MRPPAQAVSIPAEIRTFTATGSRVEAWTPRDTKSKQGFEITSADVDGDQTPEVIVGPAAGQPPRLSVYTPDGVLKRSFDVLDGKFRGGVSLANGDVDGDGVSDIIVGAGPAGGPQVAAYRGTGERLLSFRAYDRRFRGGVNVAAGDVDADGQTDIVTISGFESPGHVRLFTHQGQPRTLSLFPFGRSATYGGAIAAGDVDASHPGDEIIIVPYGPAEPTVIVANAKGKVLHRFRAYREGAKSGLTLAVANLDADEEEEIIVVPRRATPEARIYDGDGSLVRSFLVFPRAFQGSVSLSAGAAGMVLAAPIPQTIEGRTDLDRYIDIDLTKQVLTYYRLGRKIGEHKISSGKWSMPTPTGTFKTRNKISTAYSRRYKLYMDWWMAVTPDGLIGIHALPYWIIRGEKVHEGESHLGTPVSHGCIRLGLQAAKELYDWAPLGTTVIIHR